MAAPVIVALDAGGSATRCVVLTADGAVLGAGRGGPGNHILSGWERARESVRDALAAGLGAARVDAGAVALVAAGSAGVGAHGEGHELVVSLLGECLPGSRALAVGDMVAAFHGALPDGVGVVVAAGTGAVCYGRNPDGQACQVGGWGPILGDEGSAHDIAVGALRAAARAVDGRGEPTCLAERLAKALGADDMMIAALRVYGGMEREAIAALATEVSAAAAAGDRVARRILETAGEELALAASTAARTLGFSGPFTVAYAGSVFSAGRWLIDPMTAALARLAPQARLRPAEFPPIVGCFKLALHELGRRFDPAVAARVRSGLGLRDPEAAAGRAE